MREIKFPKLPNCVLCTFLYLDKHEKIGKFASFTSMVSTEKLYVFLRKTITFSLQYSITFIIYNHVCILLHLVSLITFTFILSTYMNILFFVNFQGLTMTTDSVTKTAAVKEDQNKAFDTPIEKLKCIFQSASILSNGI